MEEIQRVMDEVTAQQSELAQLQDRLNADPPADPAELLGGMNGVANALNDAAGSLMSIAQRQANEEQ